MQRLIASDFCQKSIVYANLNKLDGAAQKLTEDYLAIDKFNDQFALDIWKRNQNSTYKRIYNQAQAEQELKFYDDWPNQKIYDTTDKVVL